MPQQITTGASPSSSPLPLYQRDYFWNALPSILWFVLILLLLLLFQKNLRALLRSLTWRLKSGAAFKVASFEVGASYIPQGGTRSEGEGIVEVRKDENQEFHNQRSKFRNEDRNLLLVHKLAPSKHQNQLYDIVIYLVPSLRYGSLSSVNAVDYYFGRYWGNNIFKSIDRSTGFLIATSAYAPFTCTAKVHFTDGTSVFLHRYIDFEMGSLGNTIMREDDK
jgi:prokaryotic YEATS domain